MGASQSSTSSGAGGGRPTTKDGVDVQDYYGLLELPDPETSTSSSEEIRRAYRKLALRYHPDKNPDDVEAANKRFHLIQAAYEILSDEQEKAWYDAHREQILRGGLDGDGLGEECEEGMDEDLFQSFKNGSREPPSAPKGSSLPGLTPRQLMRFLDASLCIDTKPPSADESGFFGTFRRLFERLSEEEKGASPYPGEKAGGWEAMPSFGYSHTPYLHPKDDPKPLHQDQVRDFYTAWSSFYSRKSFGWKDGYRLHDAPDRRMRRAMEKENKRLREEARREYNDIVRSLVSFIRKRDPRFKAHTAMQSSSANGAEDMERRRQAAEQERREQEERAKAFRQQKWDAWDDKQADDSEYDSEASFGERVNNKTEGQIDQLSDGSLDEKAEQSEMLECFVCDKVFQSEAAFINHENSNKHKKQVQQIKRQMKKEDKEIHEQFDEKLVVDEAVDEPGMSKKARQRLKKRLKEQEKAATSTAENSDTESTAAKETFPAVVDTAASNATSEQAETPPAASGKGRRSKKDKKAASAKERCNVCSAGFESRSKLFAHVRETSHFLAPQTANERR